MSTYALPHKGGRGEAVGNRNLFVRITSAVCLIGIALGAAYLGGITAGLVVGIFAFAVLLEWSGITGGAFRESVPFAFAVAVAVVLTSLGMAMLAFVVAFLAVVIAALYTRAVWLPAGVVYASVFGISLILIRIEANFGLAALVFVLAVVWATDSSAFFVGRTVGGPKLAPRLSPKKTWSGAIGGLVGALLAGVVAAKLSAVPVTFGLIVVAFFLSIACQLGDLFESWIKRRFGVKDSSTIIPGHGGVMDRVDGLTFSAAAAVAIGALHAGPDNLGGGLLLW